MKKKVKTKPSPAPRPLILVAPSTEREGAEFADWSVSLSNRYTDAIIAAGGVPMIMPATTNKKVLAELVSRCDGVLMTGGDDVAPTEYLDTVPPELAKTSVDHDGPRDIWERILVKTIFDQGKPLFGICRGQQILNVVMGGTLVVDIPTQVTSNLNHSQMARKTEPVHEVQIEKDSLLAQLLGETKIGVNSTHHQSVDKVAKGLRVVAAAPDGVVEALELRDPSRLPFCLTVQFHPERMLDREAVFLRLFQGFIEASTRPRAKKR